MNLVSSCRGVSHPSSILGSASSSSRYFRNVFTERCGACHFVQTRRGRGTDLPSRLDFEYHRPPLLTWHRVSGRLSNHAAPAFPRFRSCTASLTGRFRCGDARYLGLSPRAKRPCAYFGGRHVNAMPGGFGVAQDSCARFPSSQVGTQPNPLHCQRISLPGSPYCSSIDVNLGLAPVLTSGSAFQAVPCSIAKGCVYLARTGMVILFSNRILCFEVLLLTSSVATRDWQSNSLKMATRPYTFSP